VLVVVDAFFSVRVPFLLRLRRFVLMSSDDGDAYSVRFAAVLKAFSAAACPLSV
jgi:hypothetical protein